MTLLSGSPRAGTQFSLVCRQHALPCPVCSAGVVPVYPAVYTHTCPRTLHSHHGVVGVKKMAQSCVHTILDRPDSFRTATASISPTNLRPFFCCMIVDLSGADLTSGICLPPHTHHRTRLGSGAPYLPTPSFSTIFLLYTLTHVVAVTCGYHCRSLPAAPVRIMVSVLDAVWRQAAFRPHTASWTLPHAPLMVAARGLCAGQVSDISACHLPAGTQDRFCETLFGALTGRQSLPGTFPRPIRIEPWIGFTRTPYARPHSCLRRRRCTGS